MIRAAVIFAFLSLAVAAAAPEQTDILRFTNGDQLHGHFQGIKEGPCAVWKRGDVAEAMDFKTTQVRHVVLNGGRPVKALPALSYLGLVNGDRIPGDVTGIDDKTITLNTAFAGTLQIPRKMVAILAPNPMGGRVSYHGPFIEDEWKMAHPAHPEGLPVVLRDVEEEKDEENEGDADAAPGRWDFSGSAWYWQSKNPGTALIREDGMPDRAVLRFDLAWKNRLSFAIGFHSDFAQPKPALIEGEGDAKLRNFVAGDSSALPYLFGNSYVLQVFSNYLMLYRSSVDQDGKPSIERIQVNHYNLRLGEAGRATIELRANRQSGGIALFVDDEFVAQWSEGESGSGTEYAGKGAGFGFLSQGENTPVRVSEIIVSEWNGMPDSARSLQVNEQDIVLMANGTDRFAGKAGRIEDGKLWFEGRHGNFRLPVQEIAEVRFARNALAEAPEVSADHLMVRMSPIGEISGRALTSAPSMLRLFSPAAGEMELSLDSAVMIDFNSSNRFFDDWDADF
jgi:hypothetical protein